MIFGRMRSAVAGGAATCWGPLSTFMVMEMKLLRRSLRFQRSASRLSASPKVDRKRAIAACFRCSICPLEFHSVESAVCPQKGTDHFFVTDFDVSVLHEDLELKLAFLRRALAIEVTFVVTGNWRRDAGSSVELLHRSFCLFKHGVAFSPERQLRPTFSRACRSKRTRSKFVSANALQRGQTWPPSPISRFS